MIFDFIEEGFETKVGAILSASFKVPGSGSSGESSPVKKISFMESGKNQADPPC